MARSLRKCKHDWEWTEKVSIHCVGDPFKGETYNAKCSKCGKKVWAHGRRRWFSARVQEVRSDASHSRDTQESDRPGMSRQVSVQKETA